MDFQYKDALKEGAAAFERGDLAVAKAIAETLVADDPNDPLAMGLLGCVHFMAKEYGSALACHGSALTIAQRQGIENHLYWFNAATTMSRTYHREASEACFEQSIRVEPNCADTWENYSGLMIAYGEPLRAEEYARKALAIKPESPLAHVHLGFALLMQNRWQEGWPELEYRKKRDGWTRGRYAMIDWDGKEFDGTVIIHGEQGIGDELFYCSLVKRVQELATRVVVECSKRLVPLLRRSLTCEVYGSLEECVANGALPQAVLDDEKNGVKEDWSGEWKERPRVAAMASLPFLLNVTREECADNAFLRPDPFRRLYWRAKLEKLAQGKPIIGVAWVGGAYETHKKLRNPPREMFERLDPEKYCIVSVQYTQGADKLAARMGFHHFQAAIDDLDEQAALISALDGMVSVAQAAMHIAGGLNVPTIGLIHQYPKWDCGSGDSSVPWWQSIHAIRQTSDDWAPAFDELLSELGEGTVEEVRERRLKAEALPHATEKAMRFGPLTIPSHRQMTADLNLSQIHIGGSDAQASDLRAAE